MLTRIKFNLLHPTLNAMQQQAAYQLSEVEGWDVEGKKAFKDGLTIHLHENGNALCKPSEGFNQ